MLSASHAFFRSFLSVLALFLTLVCLHPLLSYSIPRSISICLIPLHTPTSSSPGVCKGIEQMLMERGIEYDSSGCKQTSVRNKASTERKLRKTTWEADKRSRDLLTSLGLPMQVEVLEQARHTPCNCAKRTLSRQPDFATQKSGLEEVRCFTFNRHMQHITR